MSECPTCKQLYSPTEPHRCGLRAGAYSRLAAGGIDDTLNAQDVTPVTQRMDSAEPVLIRGQLTGMRLDKYEILDLVGQGGIGSVYKARHLQLESLVAIKVLRKTGSSSYKDMFLQEARLASQVRHPNIVYFSDFGVLDDGSPYLVMEFLSGKTLKDALRDSSFSPLRACQIALQIAKGLQSVHDKGIIHRGESLDSFRR